MSAPTAPGPPGNLLGHLSALDHDPFRFLADSERTYGDVVKLRFALWPAYLVTHPDHVKHVLQASSCEGRQNRRTRTCAPFLAVLFPFRLLKDGRQPVALLVLARRT